MSPYFDDEIFEEMENYIVNVSKKGNIMLLGDYNACTSNLKDFVSKEDLHKWHLWNIFLTKNQRKLY